MKKKVRLMKKRRKRFLKVLHRVWVCDMTNASDEKIGRLSSLAYKLKRMTDPYDARSMNELIREELNKPEYRINQ